MHQGVDYTCWYLPADTSRNWLLSCSLFDQGPYSVERSSPKSKTFLGCPMTFHPHFVADTFGQMAKGAGNQAKEWSSHQSKSNGFGWNSTECSCSGFYFDQWSLHHWLESWTWRRPNPFCWHIGKTGLWSLSHSNQRWGTELQGLVHTRPEWNLDIFGYFVLNNVTFHWLSWVN